MNQAETAKVISDKIDESRDLISKIRKDAELRALRAFVREVSKQDPAQVPGQRESNKERAEDLCEQWGITE